MNRAEESILRSPVFCSTTPAAMIWFKGSTLAHALAIGDGIIYNSVLFAMCAHLEIEGAHNLMILILNSPACSKKECKFIILV